MKAKRSAFALAALACSAMVLPAAASAQTYGYGYPPAYSNAQAPYYDPCLRDQRERQATAGIVGATVGAVAGSQIASRGNRTEGSLLGGLLGAVVGSSMGRSTATCAPGTPRVDYEVPPPPPPPVYQRDYGYREDRRNDGYDYYREYPESYDRGYRAPASDDGCRLAESQVRMPDGRTESRFVRTCPDDNGRYRIVD